jgi:hypothetical protein
MKTYKSNSREVSEKVMNHVKEYYDNTDALRADTEAAGGSVALVEGEALPCITMTLAVYYDDQRAFLESLKLNNNSGREFSDEDVWTMYVLLVSRAIDKLVK